MNFSDFITHSGKRINKEHFIHLILVSKSDGNIASSEMAMLHKEGRKFGLTDPEIENRMIRRFAIEAGFNDKAIDMLLEILFEGVAKGENEEVLFNEFRKKLL